MKRRVIKQGHNTFTITLPRNWAKSLNIKQGDELEVFENNSSLIINGKQHSEEKSTTIDITGFNVPMIWRFFQSAYREGYNEIKIIYDPTKKSYEPVHNYYTTQFAYARMGIEKSPKKSAFEMIQELINRFIGIEIVDHGKDYCTIREMGELTSKEFDNSLRRIFLLLLELFDEVYELIKDNAIGDAEICKSLHQMDINVDRFIDYCCRINNKIIDSSFQKNKPVMFSTLYILELLGNEFKYIGTHLATAKKKVDEVLPFAQLVREHFEMYYKLFYKFCREETIQFGENDYRIYNDHFKWKNATNKDANSIRRHFMQISKFIFVLMELRIEMEF